jgi:hypothetical protein
MWQVKMGLQTRFGSGMMVTLDYNLLLFEAQKRGKQLQFNCLTFGRPGTLQNPEILMYRFPLETMLFGNQHY